MTTVPEPRHVYIMRSADERVLYVGCTSNPPARIASHSCQQPWWRDVATVEIQHFDEPADAIAQERRLIHALDPPFNVAFRPVDDDPSIPHEDRCSFFRYCGQRATIVRVFEHAIAPDEPERRYRLCDSHAAPYGDDTRWEDVA